VSTVRDYITGTDAWHYAKKTGSAAARWRWWIFWVAAIIIVVWTLFVPDLLNPAVGALEGEALADARTDFRRILVQVPLGVAVLVGAACAARRLELARDEKTADEYMRVIDPAPAP